MPVRQFGEKTITDNDLPGKTYCTLLQCTRKTVLWSERWYTHIGYPSFLNCLGNSVQNINLQIKNTCTLEQCTHIER